MAICKVGLEKHSRSAPDDITVSLEWADGGIDYTVISDTDSAVLRAIQNARSAGLETVEVNIQVLEQLLRAKVS